MKSKPTIWGAILIILIVLVPVCLYFTHTGEKEGTPNEHMKQQAASQNKTAKEKNNSAANLKTVGEQGTTAKNEKESSEAAQGNAVADLTGNAAKPAAAEEKPTAQSDFLVVIDPGHQNRANLAPEQIGPGATETKAKVSGGTTGVATGRPEYQLTLEASQILGGILESRGVKVIFTRTSNEVNLSNRERAEIANQNNADLFVRIHADGSTDRNVHGLSVLTPAQDSPYTKAIFADSLRASQFIIDETSKNAAVKVNGISYRSDMAGFNWSKVPCTLVELGFMTNPTEDKNLSDPAYLKNLLTNIADGIMQYAAYKK